MYIVIKENKWNLFEQIQDALRFAKEDRLTVYQLQAIDNILLFPNKEEVK